MWCVLGSLCTLQFWRRTTATAFYLPDREKKKHIKEGRKTKKLIPTITYLALICVNEEEK